MDETAHCSPHLIQDAHNTASRSPSFCSMVRRAKAVWESDSQRHWKASSRLRNKNMIVLKNATVTVYLVAASTAPVGSMVNTFPSEKLNNLRGKKKKKIRYQLGSGDTHF